MRSSGRPASDTSTNGYHLKCVAGTTHLTSLLGTAPKTKDLVIVDTTWDYNAHASKGVLRGRLEGNPTEQRPATHVVCKFAPETSLREELNVYDALKDLQGQFIPKCYGLFSFEATAGETSSGACLLLEDCGTVLAPSIDEVEDWDLRMRYIEAARQIHLKGYKHGRLSADNAVKSEKGSIRIISFSHASRLNSACDPQPVNLDDTEPTLLEYGCLEIYHEADKADVWLPRTVKYFNKHVELDEVIDDTSNMDADWLFEFAPKQVDHNTAMQLAREIAQEFNEAFELRRAFLPYAWPPT